MGCIVAEPSMGPDVNVALPMNRSGVVLAGGRSTRFGAADKALEPLAGTPMTRRVADRLTAVTDEVIINCRADQEAAIRELMTDFDGAAEIAVDPVPDLGPVGGIRTGLDAASGEYSAVVACDMVFVDPSFVEYLFSRASGVDGAVPRPDKYYEVTQAVYRTSAMKSACERALEDENPKVLAPLEDLECVIVDGAAVAANAHPRTFENVNTNEEFEAAATLLASDDDDAIADDTEGGTDALDGL